MGDPASRKGAAQREPVIEVDDLVTFYGHRRILDHVSLQVWPGEILVIMGGSGSGKSTLLRYVLGLNRPRAGCIRVLGSDISRLSASELYELRGNMGVAFQGGALFGSMTLLENCMFPLREHTDLDEQTMVIMARLKLELVNLAGFENLTPQELSGGMAKRAALARAVVMDPRLLFFDEPSAGLDPVAAAELDELIVKLRDSMHITIVVVTHDMESAARIADRIVVLEQGGIIMTGTLEEVRGSANGRVQDLLQRRPREEDLDVDDYLNRLTRGH